MCAKEDCVLLKGSERREEEGVNMKRPDTMA